MSASPTCPRCGALLPAANFPPGLCPRCLLQRAVESQPASERLAGEDAAPGQFDPALAITIDRSHSAAASPKPIERALPEPGDRFGGYFILRVLGKGGMGAVYEADQLETGRRVALKVLKHSLDSPEARKRFLREGRLAAAVNHPNSVYVFGTEEIDGTPAIAMELIAGGTLQDRVKQYGPLPVGTAVDTVLQIIAGLEAAQKAGILHRDIKPANCFIDTDGSVKIGDFGLSISTGPRGDTDLTQAGTLLGTPAFSSPEQLRGDELNLRSDIYSVGVTLYYLLTGRTPFEADNMVKLLATVLERPAPSPRTIRPDIPRQLAAAILRCLEKQPADRFRDYAELRQALLPFASTAPTPATLGLRLLAYVLDGLVLSVPSTILMSLTVGILATPSTMQRDHGWLSAAALIIANTMLAVAYFGLLEGLWGRSLGKAICRLRLVRPDRAAPGIPRAAARAAIIGLVGTIPLVLSLLIPHPASADAVVDIVFPFIAWSPVLAMFLTARQSNGYAALHDLATGTRVVSREVYQSRPTLSSVDDLPPVSAALPQIGPYHVLKSLGPADGQEWILGYDARLLRRVWIHKLPAGTPAVEPSRRGLGRIGRLRWLTGRRLADENWDAYEAASGQPLVNLLDRPHSWRVVRFWLLDVAEELAAAANDGTTPVRLGLDRVWITAEGRAKLLDFRAPGAAPPAYEDGDSSASTGDIDITRRFLSHVACAALEGQSARVAETKSGIPAVPVPLAAREFLISLPALANVESAIPLLGELTRQPAEASRARRLSLALACAFPVLAILLFWTLGIFMAMQFLRKYPDIMPLQMHLVVLRDLKRHQHIPPNNPTHEGLKATPENIAVLEQYIAYRFRATIQDPVVKSSPFGPIIRPLADEVLAAHPQISEAEFRAAAKIVEPLGLGKFALRVGPLLWTVSFYAMYFIGGWLTFAAALSLATAVLCRGGLLLWTLGLAVVRLDGARASRLRVLWRAAIAWSPVVLIAIAMFIPASVLVLLAKLAGLEIGMGVLFGGRTVPAAMVGLVHLLLALWSALLPGRGIPDRLAGTWLVPH